QWDVQTGKPLTSADPPGAIRIRRFLDRTHFVAVTDRLVLYNRKAGKQVRQYPLTGTDYDLRRTELSADGKLLAIPGADGKSLLRDAETGMEVRTLEGHPRDTVVLVFSPDGKRLFSSGTENMIRVWDVKTGKQLHEMNGAGTAGGPISRVANPHEYL